MNLSYLRYRTQARESCQRELSFPQAIIAISKDVPLSVTSWIRSWERNRKVRGTRLSKHLEGLAVDILLDSPKDTPKLLKLARKYCLKILFQDTHIHLEDDK